MYVRLWVFVLCVEEVGDMLFLYNKKIELKELKGVIISCFFLVKTEHIRLPSQKQLAGICERLGLV